MVELSLSPHFRRTYTALYKAIDENDWDQLDLARLAGSCVEASKKRPYWLMGLDGTSQRRQYAYALTDRGYVYYPNPVAGNKPVTIGHEYSTVALLPEDAPDRTNSWVVPLAVERVSTQDDKELVGAEQIKALLEDDELPWHGELVVETGDSRYSKPEYLHAAHEDHPNLISVVRARGNRTLYHYLEPPEENPPHRPKYKGKAFKLPDADTHTSPDETVTLEVETKRGQTHTVELEAWSDIVMPGKNKPVRIPMENYPFRLVRVIRYDEEGEAVFARPVWLIVVGKRRAELSLEDIYEAYFSRNRLEHFFRFGKQKLLLLEEYSPGANDFQTPETPREETWWRICHLAYLMLWKALPSRRDTSCSSAPPTPMGAQLAAQTDSSFAKTSKKLCLPASSNETSRDLSRSMPLGHPRSLGHRLNRPNPEESLRDDHKAFNYPHVNAIPSFIRGKIRPQRPSFGAVFN